MTKDQLILLIDCSKRMFEKCGDDIPFELCIKVGPFPSEITLGAIPLRRKYILHTLGWHN